MPLGSFQSGWRDWAPHRQRGEWHTGRGQALEGEAFLRGLSDEGGPHCLCLRMAREQKWGPPSDLRQAPQLGADGLLGQELWLPTSAGQGW